MESIQALPTEDDLPCDDGEPMETPRHRDQMWMLIYSLQAHWADRTDYYASGNMFLHYDPQNKRRFRGPDFFLVLDVENRERKSWDIADCSFKRITYQRGYLSGFSTGRTVRL